MNSRPHYTARIAATLAAALLPLSACTLTMDSPARPNPSAAHTAPPAATAAPAPADTQGTPDNAAAARQAVAALAGIPAKGRAPKTGYDRALFGPAWKDVDRNGCDTRNDTLRRDLTALTVKPGTRECVILSGTLADAYTGKTVEFVRGSGPSVDIDHLVPLGDAWQKGAQGWSQEQREKFANDPANLAAASASANRSKGDGDLATWLPPNRGHWCNYAAGIVTVKASYGLWMTPAEHERTGQILTGCTR